MSPTIVRSAAASRKKGQIKLPKDVEFLYFHDVERVNLTMERMKPTLCSDKKKRRAGFSPSQHGKVEFRFNLWWYCVARLGGGENLRQDGKAQYIEIDDNLKDS